MSYIDIQNEIIAKYRITISDGAGCWRRTHAHVKERKVCKWKQANSVQSLFTLLHEIGHIETTKSTMRRAEAEYYATMWALDKCREYKIEVPDKILKLYQDYIDRELERGQRRGGTAYPKMRLA